MKLTRKMIERIEEQASDMYREYDYIGVRVQDEEFVLGEQMSHVSHVWVDGVDTGVELQGVCAIRADMWPLVEGYYGQHIAIIASNHVEYGEDAGEYIMHSPDVLEVLA